MPRSNEKTNELTARTPQCPRCGYDLSGVVESWTEQCPVDGVCSECGLGFEWMDVLVMDRQRLSWLYEHARGVSVRTAFVTTLMSIHSWLFWNRVHLHHRVSVQRLCAYPLVVLAGLYLVSTAFGLLIFGARALMFGTSAKIDVYGTWLENVGYLLTSQSGSTLTVYGWDWSGYSSGPYIAGVLIWSMSFGIMLSALISQSSFKNTTVRSAHLLRITSYSVVPAMSSAVLFSALWVCDRIVRHDYGGSMYFYYASSPSSPYFIPTAWDQIRMSLREWVEGPYFTLLFPSVFLYIWWFIALRKGLRLLDWWQILIAGLFLGPLIAMVIGFAGSAVLGWFT